MSNLPDTSGVFYFSVDTGYKYNADAEKLTFRSHFQNLMLDLDSLFQPAVCRYFKVKEGNGKILCICWHRRKVSDDVLGDFYCEEHDLIKFVNSADIPASVFDSYEFTLSISRSPKEAEQLKDSELVVGVKVLDYQKSAGEGEVGLRPTGKSANYEVFLIAVRFVSLFLFDTSSKKILAKYELPD